MQTKKLFVASSLLLVSLGVKAADVVVERWQNLGTQTFRQPFMVDSLDVNGNPYRGDSTLTTLRFAMENTRYAKATLRVEGNRQYKLYLDGTQMPGNGSHPLTLLPATHTVDIVYGGSVCPKIILHTDSASAVTLPQGKGRLYTLDDVLYNTRIVGASLSPDGKYLIAVYSTTIKGGRTTTVYRLTDRTSGTTLAESTTPIVWMPRSNRYVAERQTSQGRTLVSVNPVDRSEKVLADHLPQGRYVMSPDESFLVFTAVQNGPAERKDVFEVIDPDDRQPGYRNRSSLQLYDFATKTLQPLTFGHSNTSLLDISADGRRLLFSVARRHLQGRPTSLTEVYVMDRQSMQTVQVIAPDGFVAGAVFSPDASRLLVCGSPECFGGIGENVRQGQTPSMFDYQLYLLDIASRKTTPLTRNFNPSVKAYKWSKTDGMVYFTAEHKDSVCLYRLNPNTFVIKQVCVPEDMVTGFSVASSSTMAAWWGQSASNSDRLYTLDLRSLKSRIADDVSARNLDGIALGDCRPWTYCNEHGDTLTARYYLPPHFDASKKYPMIVNYYGGCSPIGRNLESRYSPHLYAALGYVVLVLEPSGCTGFGQEFSARHVNAYGDYTADDIIVGTRLFCSQHPWVNSRKVGCIGASYGGFMTQYLQTRTDIFAAAISHAGISDITGYWGYGYWGYSYNEVAAAGSYPWNNKELYVDHSPLYNADKIHTPLLFLHGTSDHNVPLAQSVAMYTALKLLGRETALVEVTGQDHHIQDHALRARWEHTIYAWFAKWLQDDPAWWNDMYPPKNL